MAKRNWSPIKIVTYSVVTIFWFVALYITVSWIRDGNANWEPWLSLRDLIVSAFLGLCALYLIWQKCQKIMAHDTDEISNFRVARAEDFDRVYELDKIEYGKYGDGDVIPVETCRAWSRPNPRTCILMEKGDRIVGYYAALPLKPKALEMFLRGAINEKGIQGSDVRPSSEAKDVEELYFASVVSDSSEPGSGHRLVQRVLDELEMKAAYPNLRKIYAIAATKKGQRLLERLKFVKIGDAVSRMDKHDLYEYTYPQSSGPEMNTDAPKGS